MTLYRETPCEHEITGRHLKGDNSNRWCPGTTREEVTIDYDGIAKSITESLRPITSGRFGVSPEMVKVAFEYHQGTD